jgi:hypothetical protein
MLNDKYLQYTKSIQFIPLSLLLSPPPPVVKSPVLPVAGWSDSAPGVGEWDRPICEENYS